MAGPQLNFGGTNVVNPYTSLVDVLGRNGALAQNMIAKDEAEKQAADQAYRDQQLLMAKDTHQLQVDAANQVKQDRAANTAFYSALNAPQTMQQATMTNLATAKPELFKSMELTPEEQAATAPGGTVTPEMKASIANKRAQQEKVAQVASMLPNREDMLGTTSEQYMRAANDVASSGLPLTDTMQKMLLEQKAADRHVLTEAEKANTAKSLSLSDKLDKLYLDSAKNENTSVLGTDSNGNAVSINTGTKSNPVAALQLNAVKNVGDNYNKLVADIDKLETGSGKTAIPLSADLRGKALVQADGVYKDLVSRNVPAELARTIALSKVQPQGDGSTYLGLGSAKYKLGDAAFTPEELKIINRSVGIEGEKQSAEMAKLLPPVNNQLHTAYSTLLSKVGASIAANNAEKSGLSMSPEAKRVNIAGGLLARELGDVVGTNGTTSGGSGKSIDIENIPETTKAAIAESAKYLQGKGWNGSPAYSAIANLVAESNFDPKATGDKGSAQGMFQWRNDRLDALKKFAGTTDVSSIPLNTQLDFMDKEIRTRPATKEFIANYRKENPGDNKFISQYDELHSFTDPKDAAAYFSKEYEVAKGNTTKESEATRRGYMADKLFNTQPQQEAKERLTTEAKPSTEKRLSSLEITAEGDPYDIKTIAAKQELEQIEKNKKSVSETLLSKPIREWSDSDLKAASNLPDIPKDKRNYDLIDMLSPKTPMVQDPAKTRALKILQSNKADKSAIASVPEEGLDSSNLDWLPAGKVLGKVVEPVGNTVQLGLSKVPLVGRVIKSPIADDVVAVPKKLTVAAKKKLATQADKAAKAAKLKKENDLTNFLMGID